MATLLKIPTPLYAATALGAGGLELIIANTQNDFGIAGIVLIPAAVLSVILGGIPTAIDAITRLPPPSAK